MKKKMKNKNLIFCIIILILTFVIVLTISCYKFTQEIKNHNTLIKSYEFKNWINKTNPKCYTIYEFKINDTIYCYYKKSLGFIIWNKESEGLR